ncbi:MAG: transporter substrate-binding protein [Subtercola sp.]|nr:transporter substrate-binding protein [Subtercola sp.]
MKKPAIFAATAVALALALSGCADDGGGGRVLPTSTAAAPTGAPILIGMDLDKTGPGSSYNPLAGAAVVAGVDEVNANGGILGRPVKLIEESTESDPAKGPAVYQSLIEQGAVGILGLSTASVVAQVKPIIEQAKVVTIAPVAVLPTLTDQPDGDYVYTLVNPVTDYGSVFCGAFEKAGIKKIAYLQDDSPAIKSLAGPLKDAFGKCVTIVDDEVAPVASTDLVAQATRIKDSNPDAIFVQSVGGQFEALAHSALYQAMPDVPRFSQGSFGSQSDAWALATPGSLNNLVFMQQLDLTNPRTVDLQSKLTAALGSDFNMSYFAAQGYDGLMILLDAIKTAGGTDDPAAIKAAMDATTGYQPHVGQEGFRMSFTPTKHVGADSLCGLALFTFGADNTPAGKWSTFQPAC